MYIIDTQTYSIRKVRNCHSLGRYKIADTWDNAYHIAQTLIDAETDRLEKRKGELFGIGRDLLRKKYLNMQIKSIDSKQ